MSIKCVGYEVKKGTFTNEATGEVINYDNTLIYYTNDDVEGVTGAFCGSLKIKNPQLAKVLRGLSVDDIVGCEIRPVYSPYGSRVVLSSIEVL